MSNINFLEICNNFNMYDSIWYDLLNKPPLTPPSEMFLPVWSILYVMIFCSLIIFIFSFSRRNKIKGCTFFMIQIILNLLWSPAFFYLQSIGLALFIVVLLDIFVTLTIIEFWNVSKLSATLLIPYFVWILFATYLNIGFFRFN